MYTNFQEVLQICQTENLTLPEAILRQEIQLFSQTEYEIFQTLRQRLAVMRASAEKALTEPQSAGFSWLAGMASQQLRYAEHGETLMGAALNRAMAFALSCSETNAAMGRICAAPTAGACGILPAVTLTMEEQFHLEEKQVLNGLLVAAGFGAIIQENATVSGAEGGCQAECGVAAAMAAAAAVFWKNGTPETSMNAAAFALSNAMGLVCDPVEGLVQIPCAQRNASQTLNALLSADLALGGMQSLVPLDGVVAAMLSVGRQLPPALRETAKGGLAQAYSEMQTMTSAEE